ncbi:MAG: aminopeptidase P N-terminal domain-containing protein [Bacteroidales bacterium]|jgi:Xaa-Pro aminopeptidase|nr:aminopeptidase P N-terminal domain-containing protein [Bacteroidales bacterium]
MRYHKIDNQFFTNNREAFAKKMEPNSVAIFVSNDEHPRNGDQFFPFRQSSDLFYLSGIEQEKTILMLAPDCPNPKLREVLFVLKTSEHIAVWYGHKYTQEEAKETSGIENVHWTDEMDMMLREAASYSKNIYLNEYEYPKYASDVESGEQRFTKEIKQLYPLHVFERSAPILYHLRLIKSETEIDLIKEACEITNKAFRRILQFVKPDVMEFEIQAEIEHEFTRKRANGHGYYPIIATGENACVLHYIENDKVCKDGDVILFDFGAEYANYSADMSRSIPVNGKFTERQRAVYQAVLRTLDTLTENMLVGKALDDLDKLSKILIEKELISLGLFTEIEVKNQDLKEPLFKKYFMHGVNHHLGLDVHDVGNRNVPLTAGMVFTCEPGIYIPEESLGIRLENDILITENGPVNLMENIPIEIEEIERLMSK